MAHTNDSSLGPIAVPAALLAMALLAMMAHLDGCRLKAASAQVLPTDHHGWLGATLLSSPFPGAAPAAAAAAGAGAVVTSERTTAGFYGCPATNTCWFWARRVRASPPPWRSQPSLSGRARWW